MRTANPPAHQYPVGAKIRLTEPVTVGGSVRNEQTGEILDRTYVEVRGSFYVVRHTRDTDGTPLYTLSPYNDPEDWRTLNWYLTNISEESLTPEPVTLTNPALA